MARPKQQPIPESADTDMDDDDDDNGSSFDNILENLTAQKNSGVDANMILMMQMMQKSNQDAERMRREEKESRRHNLSMMIALLTPVLPILVEKIFGAKSNPMLEKLLEVVMNKSGNTDMLKECMTFMMTGNQATLNNAISQLTAVSEIKGKILEEELERAKNRDSDDKESNPFIDGLHEVTQLVQAMKKPSDPLNAKGPGLDDPTPQKIAVDNGSATPAKIGKTPPIVIFLRTLYMLNTKGDSMTPQARSKMRTGLCMAIQDDDKLCKAILDGDRDTLMEMGTPVVTADKELMAWIIKPGVEPWILAYINRQLGPALDELVNAEDYAAQPEEADDDETADDKAVPSASAVIDQTDLQ